MLLKEIKNIFHKELDAIYSKEEVASFFYLLIEHYLGLQRFVLAIQPDLIISKEEEQPLFEALSQLRLERPIQYIIGTAHFMEMDFGVTENVLIPRPETEELVQWVIEEYHTDGRNHGDVKKKQDEEVRILDIGTGSGCIAIALAKNLPHIKVTALDVSSEALMVAKQNAIDNDVNVTFVQADMLQLEDLGDKFDCIVSNPPYVRMLEKKEMQRNVTEHEPDMALFVSDENPLVFYKAICRIAKKNLKKSGSLYLEINQYLAKETEQLLKDHNFSEIELRKDMFGNNRMLRGVFSGRT